MQNFENKIVAKVQSKVKLVTANNHIKNFLSYNLADIFANFFGDISSTLIYNLDNILAFYYWLFAYLTARPLINTVSIHSSYSSFDLIEVE